MRFFAINSMHEMIFFSLKKYRNASAKDESKKVLKLNEDSKVILPAIKVFEYTFLLLPVV